MNCMKNILKVLLIFFSTILSAQNFKGEIIYSNTYESKIAHLSNVQLSGMLGNIQNYFTQNGNYKSITNGTLVLWQLYLNKENKLYNKMGNSETIYWNDCSVQGDEIVKVEINKNATIVLGMICDEIILVCTSGIQKYYFSSSLGVDPNLFMNHKLGNWYDYISKAKAFPLKITIDNQQFKMISIAKKVDVKDISDSFFDLPKGVKVEQVK